MGQMVVERLRGTGCHITTLARSAAPGNHISADINQFDAYEGFDTVIHCAAMKDVVRCETQIEECIASNVTGTAVALRNASKAGVDRYIYISTDMAVEPQSVYGASKKLADAMVTSASRDGLMQTAVIRFGNIIGRSGSVMTLFAEKAAQIGYVPITDASMTRFLMSATNCADFVIRVARQKDLRGEIFVPRCKSYRILDMAEAVAPEVPVKIVGLRPGDMLSVKMISSTEALRTSPEEDMYRIIPVWAEEVVEGVPSELTSANNSEFASIDQLRQLYLELTLVK